MPFLMEGLSLSSSSPSPWTLSSQILSSLHTSAPASLAVVPRRPCQQLACPNGQALKAAAQWPSCPPSSAATRQQPTWSANLSDREPQLSSCLRSLAALIYGCVCSSRQLRQPCPLAAEPTHYLPALGQIRPSCVSGLTYRARELRKDTIFSFISHLYSVRVSFMEFHV